MYLVDLKEVTKNGVDPLSRIGKERDIKQNIMTFECAVNQSFIDIKTA